MSQEGRALHAEPLGRVLAAFLELYFPQASACCTCCSLPAFATGGGAEEAGAAARTPLPSARSIIRALRPPTRAPPRPLEPTALASLPP